MDESLLVAIACFPGRGYAIKEPAKADKGFQSLCEDFAAA